MTRTFRNKTLKTKFPLLIPIIVISLLISSCNEDDLADEAFTIGDEFVSTSTRVIYQDTFSVELSTVILDSVRTSGTGAILVGRYEDGPFGTITAQSYFQVAYAEEDILEDDVFDSITLCIRTSGYYYGDTLIEQRINVYRLLDKLEPHDNGNLYNTSNILYDQNPLGIHSYKPRPGKNEYVEIRLNDELGLEFFQKMKNNDEEMTDSVLFLEYFKGVAIGPGDDLNAAIIDFSAVDSGAYLNLHYHRIDFDKNELEAHFKITNSSNQFNKIEVDRSNTVLNSWTQQRDAIPSSETNNQVFVQGITGLLTNIEFPSLDNILEYGDDAKLIKAELMFSPVKNTYDQIGIPDNTVLYQTDRINRLYTPVYDLTGESVQYGATYVDNLYHENTSISFDITNYLLYDFQDDYYNQDYGFMLGLSDPEYQQTFDRIILGGLNNHNHKPILKIHYMLYE